MAASAETLDTAFDVIGQHLITRDANFSGDGYYLEVATLEYGIASISSYLSCFSTRFAAAVNNRIRGTDSKAMSALTKQVHYAGLHDGTGALDIQFPNQEAAALLFPQGTAQIRDHQQARPMVLLQPA